MLEGRYVSAKRRWWLIGAAVVFALVVLAVLLAFRKDIGTWYVARALRAASTPEQEQAACAQMSRWAHSLAHGYRVETEDASGTTIRPWQTGDRVAVFANTGDYDRVAVLIITWDNGTKVRRSLLDKDSLVSVFGE